MVFLLPSQEGAGLLPLVDGVIIATVTQAYRMLTCKDRPTRFCDWHFIHRGRLDCLPLNGTRRFNAEGDKWCRRCGYATEMLPHVINHRRHQLVNMNGRHDAILDRIVKAVPASVGTVSINRKVADSRFALKPDLVVTDVANRKVVIMDVTVPFENRFEALVAARQAKMEKYEPLVLELTEKGFNVEMDALVVGSLGVWDPANERTLRILKIGRRYSRLMKELITSEAIQWSRDIYIQHVTGHPQRQARPTRLDTPPIPDRNDTNDNDDMTPAPTCPNIPTNSQLERNRTHINTFLSPWMAQQAATATVTRKISGSILTATSALISNDE